MPENNEIVIDLDAKVTPKLSCVLIKGLIDYLLHHRHQIPFTFDLFEKSVKNFKDEGDFKTKKLMNLAKETHARICDIKTLIETTELETTKSIYLIFGKSLVSATESIEIQLPSEFTHTSPTFTDNSTLKRVLLQLIQNDNYLASSSLAATNVFFVFSRTIPTDNKDLLQLRDFKLNKSCKKFSISFRYASTFDFEVFQDLSLNECDSLKELTKKCDKGSEETVYYQSKIFVKGFNDVLVNKKLIWNF